MNPQALHWIILLPLIGAAINGLLGKRLGRGNVHIVALGAVFGAFVVSAIALWNVSFGGAERISELWWHWFTIGEVPVEMALSVDRLSATLICVVTGVGFLIHLFSTEYMSHDEGYWRYFAYLNLFVAAMATLVLGSNLLVMFVGWEGVGLASYLLIGFWYTDDEKAYAGRKAFVVNRIGDFGFLLGIFAVVALFGTIDFAELQVAAANLVPSAVLQGGVFAGWTLTAALTLACLLLFVGATGKSAQIPLYVWLPDAMAGPTPVSALIHAATMVTAGVYMIARLSFLYVYAPGAMATVAIVGAATAVFAALMAYAQNDIKKVLAYSTVSQLGFMFIGVGVGAWWAAIYHLVTHAFFKACLFLGAGSVMHGMKDQTDIRLFGGLRKEMWHTWATFGISTIAITGVLPLSGFFSKDAILHAAHANPNLWFSWVPTVAYVLGLIAALSTSFYMWRMFNLTFNGERRGMKDHRAHESGPAMTGPLWVLSGLAVGAAVWGLPLANGARFERFLRVVFAPAEANLRRVTELAAAELGVAVPPAPAHDFAAMLPGYLIALAIALVGFGIAWYLYLGPGKGKPALVAERAPGLYAAFANKFYVDEFYDAVVVRPLKGFARVLWQVVDSFAIDRLLVNGTAVLSGWTAQLFRYFQDGNVQRYAVVMAVSAVAVLWVFLF
ncbi:MAG TPA: NADH-quinone oxidoreductase subunit L [Vulgatibacter sp.]|nr:NADH-quinone oxidoreductase subunit L [Vulgatibacter sp.]